MVSIKHRFDLRITVSAISFLCAVLGLALIHARASNDLIDKLSVELRASRTLITYPCPPCMHSATRTCPTEFEPRVELTATALGFNKSVAYSYAVTSGQIVGEGSRVTWDFSNSGPGVYTATVEAQDKKHRASASVTVTMASCGDCMTGDCECPMIVVNCYDTVRPGTAITCKFGMVGKDESRFTLEWSARTSNGEGLSQKIRKTGDYVSIPTDGLGGRVVHVTVEVKGLDPTCNSTASGSTVVKP